MLTLLRTLSVGYFGQHFVRICLVVLTIALGVAALVATRALNKGLGSGIQDGVNPLSGLADLMIVNGETGVPAKLAEELRQAEIEGVEDARPFILWRVHLSSAADQALKHKGKSVNVWLFGVEMPRADKQKQSLLSAKNALGVEVEQTWQPKTWRDYLRLTTEPPAFVSPNLARELGRANDKFGGLPAVGTAIHLARELRLADGKGESFQVQGSGGKKLVFTTMGTVDFSNSNLPLKESYVVVAELMAASRVCFPDNVGVVHQISVKLSPGADAEQTRERIEAWVGDRAQVQTVDASKAIVSDVTAGLEMGLNLGAVGALVVGLFLIYIVLSVSVAERRHDIGILRSVGATRLQVARLFVGEAAVLGLIGSLLGVPLGWFMAWLIVKPMAGFITELIVPIDGARVELSWVFAVVASIAGVVVTMLAALVPAVQAASEEPAEAVRRAPRRGFVLLAVLQALVNVLLIGLGVAFVGWRSQVAEYYNRPWLSMWGAWGAFICLFLAGLVVTPLLTQVLGKLFQPLFRHCLGLEGRLAADNLVRSPGRTGIVIAALAATGALMVGTAGFVKSTREAVRDWVDDKIAADLFVSSGSTVTAGGTALGMHEGLPEKLAGVPGVTAVVAVKWHLLNYHSPVDGVSRIIYVAAVDTQALSRANGLMMARNVPGVGRLREPGKVLVSDNFAALYKVQVGDRIVLPGRNRLLPCEIIGTVTDYSWNRGTVIMDLTRFREEYGNREINVCDLFLEEGADVETVRKEILARWGAEETLFAVTRPEVHADVSRALQNVYALAYAQQGVVGLVALKGVALMLMISVLQRRRDLGLLRAVGANRAQVLRSVLAEAVLMGLIGAALGFGLGLLLQWYVLNVMLPEETGFTFAFRVPWLEAGVVMLGSVVLATLAGLAPAYQATRLRIPEAIAYE